jgi:hypothetical protein
MCLPIILVMGYQLSFYWRYIAKLRNRKNRNKVILELYNRQKGGGKESKNCQIHICGFPCVAKDIEGRLKICTLFLFNSQIWLNLSRHDRHFFQISQLMISTLAKNRNS